MRGCSRDEVANGFSLSVFRPKKIGEKRTHVHSSRGRLTNIRRTKYRNDEKDDCERQVKVKGVDCRPVAGLRGNTGHL